MNHPAAVTLPPLHPSNLVLDLATPEGCKAELSKWWLHPKIVYLPKMVIYLRNNWAVSWPGFEPATLSDESDVPNYLATVERH